MAYEGKVTKVNYFFWYFELNHKIRVHMSILVAQDPSFRLPILSSKVCIKNTHRNASTFVACDNSEITGSLDQNFYCRKFLDFISTYELGAADLMVVDKCLLMFEQNFKNEDEISKNSLIFSILYSAVQHSVIKTRNDHSCLNKIFSHIDINSVTSCRFAKLEPKSYPDFPYWSLGVNMPSKNLLLFGLLQIQKFYGFFMLKDSSYQIACVIYNCTASDLHKLVCKYILIKNYRVITEIYNADGVPSLDYMIVDFTDIIMISPHIPSSHNTVQNIVGFGANSVQTEYKYSIEFELKQKSNVLIGTKEPEYYLNVLITAKNGAETTEVAFLIFPKEYISSLLFLETNGTYKLHHNETLQITTRIELVRLSKNNIYQINEKEAHLQVLKSPGEPEEIVTVETCKNSLKSKTDLISFRGTLKQKRFANSLSSRTVKRTNLYGFGTPGTRVNQLVFSCINSLGKEEYLDCYLNNWENLLMPLGLIPDMELIVRNVAPQSKKYLKATVLTTIEILSYKSAVNFQTVNLFVDEDINWGPKYYLGQGNSIPFSALIWGRVHIVQILSVKLSKICRKCKLVNETTGCCTQCGETEMDLNFMSKLHVSDEFGQSKVLIKNKKCMMVFLDLQEKQSELLMKALDEIGNYSYSLFDADIESTCSNTEKDIFKNILTEYLTTFNRCSLGSFDLKCRKLDSNPSRNGGRPLWFLLDIRKT